MLSIILILIILALISEPTSENKIPAKIDKEVLYLNCYTLYIDKQKRNISGTIVKTVIL